MEDQAVQDAVQQEEHLPPPPSLLEEKVVGLRDLGGGALMEAGWPCW